MAAFPPTRFHPSQHPKTQSTRLIRKVLGIIIILMIIIFGWIKIKDPQTFPVRGVKIHNTGGHVSHDALKETVMPYLSHGFLFMPSHALQQTLQTFSWVKQATVKRQWPDKIRVFITEYKILGIWNERAFLSTDGDVFMQEPALFTKEKKAAGEMPFFYGPEGSEKTVWQMYKNLSASLADLNLKVIKLSCDLQKSWEVFFSDGLHVVLGSEKIKERWDQFIAVYPRLLKNFPEGIHRIDMRYESGFAVAPVEASGAT